MIKEKIHEEVLKLSEKERAELAHLLIESLRPYETYDSEETWAEELKRKVDRFESGEGEMTSWNEVKIEAKEMIEN